MSHVDNIASDYSWTKEVLARSKIRICRTDEYIGHFRRFSDANEIHSAAAASRFAGRNENSYRSRAVAR